jgi:RNA polymerase sigma factor (sigma-70 family)
MRCVEQRAYAGRMSKFPNFERLLLTHIDAAHNLAYWLLRDHEDAQDVVQDAYLRAFRARDAVTGDDIKPWLLTIVRNVAYRWLSVRKRTANVISFEGALSARDTESERALDVPSEEPSAEDVLVSRAEQAMIRSALAELPPVVREVIVLRELEGMTYREIADITNVPIGTVMSRLARAREQLRLALAPLLAKETKNAL